MRNNRRTRRQLTDAELRRALDYAIGDVVRLIDYPGRPQGTIEATKLNRGGVSLMYVVRTTDGTDIKFVMACADDMDFIRHADGEI